MSQKIKLREPGKRAFSNDKAEHPRLRLVSEQPSRPVGPDPEIKAMLEDMNRRYRVNRERLVATGDDEPSAA